MPFRRGIFIRGVALGLCFSGVTAVTLRRDAVFPKLDVLNAKISLFSKNEETKEGKRFGNFVIDSEKSKLNVFVYKAGPLSAMGHNLCMRVTEWDSNVAISPNGDYTLTVNVNPSSIIVEGQVKIDAKGAETVGSIDSWSKGQIIQTMQSSTVLDVKKFATIVYRGNGKREDSGLKVSDGELLLKGNTRPLPITGVISFDQTPSGEARLSLKGEVKVTQSKWGIKPLSQGFGALSLKDDVKVTWDVSYILKA